MSKIVTLSHELLQSVTKPARYTGGEWNSVVHDSDVWDKTACKWVLSLPDLYEVGMSNLGLAILYEILNYHDENILAERVYAPDVDMEKAMRERELPLFSLETRHEVSSFDIWGFSLQYEMIYSNVLNMLDLAKIPLWTQERLGKDVTGEKFPFIVGGGPCVYNVEPLADFFDFFIIGEGEEVILEVSQLFTKWSTKGKKGGRQGFLRELLKVPGVYVPSFYQIEYDANGNFTNIFPLAKDAKPIIYKRVIHDFDKAKSVEHPLVPMVGIVHDRLMLELFRGCSRGCRFCQAGVSYRPVRERTRERLFKMAQSLLDNSGYEEMSLTSLSSADYSCLNHLVDDLLESKKEDKVNFSLPSLRIDSFSIELAQKLQAVRKSGLTFAPEAGTQRLRDVINKGVTEEDLLTACSAAFRYGWKQVKLYFMMGLPTETDEDIIGIADLAQKVVDLYQSITHRRGVKVTVSCSCFVPKPFTPFQWAPQLSLEEFERRQHLLKTHIKDKSIVFRYHDARVSLLEGAFARGDRRLSKVLYQAWHDGAKFDGWSEFYKDEIWQNAAQKVGIDLDYYNARERMLDEPLPWSHTSPGISEKWLKREWEKSQKGLLTVDCRHSECSGCGVCPTLGAKVVDYTKENTYVDKVIGTQKASENEDTPVFNYRAEITKGENLRYLSHLDYVNVFLRGLKRAKLPVAHSKGFNPHIKASFASALSLGVTSEAEYVDFSLTEYLLEQDIIERLNKALPQGAKVKRIKLLKRSHKAVMSLADEARYTLVMPCTSNEKHIQEIVAKYTEASTAIFHRITPKKRREVDTKKYLLTPIKISLASGELRMEMSISITPSGSVKPIEILTVLTEQFGLPVNPMSARITREGIFGKGRSLMELS